MRRLIDRCAGIDVGQALLVVCVRVVDEKGRLDQQIRSFGATTPDLLDLRDWLTAACRVPELGHGVRPAVSGSGFVLVDEPAEDRSTPDLAVDPLGDGRSPSRWTQQ
jgi:hypothetical protein